MFVSSSEVYFGFKSVNKCLFELFCDLGASRDWHYTEPAVWRHFVFIFQHCKTSQLLQLFRRMLLWRLRNILWTNKLHLPFHQHGGEWTMTKYSFLAELPLVWACAQLWPHLNIFPLWLLCFDASCSYFLLTPTLVHFKVDSHSNPLTIRNPAPYTIVACFTSWQQDVGDGAVTPNKSPGSEPNYNGAFLSACKNQQISKRRPDAVI